LSFVQLRKECLEKSEKEKTNFAVRVMPDSPEKSSRMKLSDFEVIRTLGTGSFGRVKFAKSKIDGGYYAVKYMKKHDIIKLKQGMQCICQELTLSQLTT
jgi:protein kinase A